MPPENDNLVIDGTEDEVQLTVQGHSTQTNPLQQWEKSDGTPVAKLHDDARLQVGDEPAMATPDALLEANRNDAQQSGQVAQAERGLHTSANIENQGGDANIEWSVHEVTVGDGANLGKVTALRAGVTNQGNGAVDEAVGLEIADITGATDNYAIKTGQGVAQFGDALEMGEIDTPNAPAAGVRLYTKSDQKLYMRPAGGSEQEVGSGSGGASALNDLTDVNAPSPTDQDILIYDNASSQWVPQSLENATVLNLLDVGMIVPFMGNVPSNALLCDGSTYTKAAFRGLYAKLEEANSALIIDANNFKVPDLRDRTVFGAGTDLSQDDTGGEKDHTLTIDEMPAHTHYIGNVTANFNVGSGNLSVSGGSGSRYSGASGGNQSHNNMPPYFTASGWCIIYALKGVDASNLWNVDGNNISYGAGNVNITNDLTVIGTLSANGVTFPTTNPGENNLLLTSNPTGQWEYKRVAGVKLAEFDFSVLPTANVLSIPINYAEFSDFRITWSAGSTHAGSNHADNDVMYMRYRYSDQTELSTGYRQHGHYSHYNNGVVSVVGYTDIDSTCWFAHVSAGNYPPASLLGFGHIDLLNTKSTGVFQQRVSYEYSVHYYTTTYQILNVVRTGQNHVALVSQPEYIALTLNHGNFSANSKFTLWGID